MVVDGTVCADEAGVGPEDLRWLKLLRAISVSHDDA